MLSAPLAVCIVAVMGGSGESRVEEGGMTVVDVFVRGAGVLAADWGGIEVDDMRRGDGGGFVRGLRLREGGRR